LTEQSLRLRFLVINQRLAISSRRRAEAH